MSLVGLSSSAMERQAASDRCLPVVESKRLPCDACGTPMEPEHAHYRCPSCGWRNVINCPSCDRPLHPETHDGLRLDVCRSCRGVWFDHVELAEIWRLTLNASQHRSVRGKSSVAGDVGFGAAEALAYSPHLFIYGAQTAGMGIEAGAHALSNAPEVVVAAIEGAGDAAEGIFHAVMEIIEGIFS